MITPCFVASSATARCDGNSAGEGEVSVQLPKPYVPLLRWRQGEYEALFRLGGPQKDAILPLIEILKPDYDFEQRKPKRGRAFGPLDARIGPALGERVQHSAKLVVRARAAV